MRIQISFNWKAPNGVIFYAGQIFSYLTTTYQSYQVDCFHVIPMTHYVVVQNEVTYYIPEYFAARTTREPEEGNPGAMQKFITEFTKDASQKEDGTFDVVQATKDFYGVDISAKPFGNQIDYSTPKWLRDKIDKINNRSYEVQLPEDPNL